MEDVMEDIRFRDDRPGGVGGFYIAEQSGLLQVLWDECEELGITGAYSVPLDYAFPSPDTRDYKSWDDPDRMLGRIFDVFHRSAVLPLELCQLAGMGSKIARRLVAEHWRDEVKGGLR